MGSQALTDNLDMGCAQLKVTGSGAGAPGPTVKFPGAYDPKDPGILVNMCMFSPFPFHSLIPSISFYGVHMKPGVFPNICVPETWASLPEHQLINTSQNRLASSATVHPSRTQDLARSLR